MIKRVALLLALVAGSALPGGVVLHDSNRGVFVTGGTMSFEESATLDTSDILDLRPHRADWDHAMRLCLAAGYTHTECYESVTDGEF